MPDQTTVASLFQSEPLAMCLQRAQSMLSLPLAQMDAVDAGQTEMAASGERFVVSRGVAVVPVRGLLTPNMFILERWLGWTTYHGLEQTMTELAANDEVSAIVLEVDTPGGFVLGIQSAADAIITAKGAKPVHVLVNPLCASAGYWLASQATDISATAGSVIGSIGVALMAGSFMQPGAFSGMQLFEMASSHARAKRPDPATDEGRDELQRSLDETEALFHAAVAQGRGIPVDNLTERLSVTDDPADGGATFDVAGAINRGLVDRAEPRRAFYDRIYSAYAPKPRPNRRAQAMGAAARRAQAIAQS